MMILAVSLATFFGFTPPPIAPISYREVTNPAGHQDHQPKSN
jgi:hypothetical protein